MNISDIRLITYIAPRLRFIIKRFLQLPGKIINPHLMGNAFLSAKLYPYGGNSNGLVLSWESIHRGRKDSQGIPIPPSEFTFGYPDEEVFLTTGKEDIYAMLRILTRASVTLKKGERILEFGCSCGRLIRWLHDFALHGEVWGVDISSEHIAWCKHNLSPPFHFLTNTTAPHLPFEDNYFDFVFAGSVFTHIDDLADAWFMELRRILKPNGKLYVTIHDTTTLEIFSDTAPKNSFADAIVRSTEYRRFSASKGLMFVLGRSAYSQVFYDTEYFRNQVSKMFILLSVTPRAYREIQTAYLLQK